MSKGTIMLNKEELIEILSVRPCTLNEICIMFDCSVNEATEMLERITNVVSQSGYYYVGKIEDVFGNYTRIVQPAILCYVNTKKRIIKQNRWIAELQLAMAT
jgi:hypothetical protein